MNKILLVIVVIVIAVGGFMVLGGKNENPAPSAKTEEIPTPTQTQLNEEEKVTTVTLTDTGFTPKDITVKVGTKVVWTNSSGKDATVNSDDHPTHLLYSFLNLGRFADGSSVEVVVEKAGEYSYHNHLNSSETGTITAE